MVLAGRRSVVLLVLALLPIVLVRGASLPVSLVVFGDSLSDNGNSFKLFNGTFPETGVYFAGRFTNAPGTWVDQLKAKATFNYAFGGATACTWPDITGRQAEIPSMQQEVDEYLNSAKTYNGTKIVVLWGGHNDYLSINQLPLFQRFTVPGRVRRCMARMAEAILKKDPKVKVVVGGVMALNKASFDFTLKLIPSIVKAWNTKIAKDIAKLHAKYDGRVVYWDINSVLEPVLDKPTKFGIKMSSGSCVQFKLAFEGFFRDFSFDLSVNCKQPNDFFFYDPIHPTAKVHGILAANLKLTLKKNKYI